VDPASGFQSVLVALLLGHLLGDFVVQRRSLVHAKLQHRPSAYARHALHHYLLALLVLQPYLTWRPLGGWLVQLVLVGLVAVHAAIDVGKVRLAGESGDGVVAFLVDQIAHLATLVAAAAVLAPSPIESYAIFDPWLEPAIAPAVVIVAVVFAGGFLIRLLLRPLEPDMEEEGAIDLSNAGLYIGWLERAFVLLAVIARSPEAIGFVVAAKSIVRFPSLKDRPFAEYFLIGTLFSVLLATVGGMILVAMGMSLR
jgi:hypothetical protein